VNVDPSSTTAGAVNVPVGLRFVAVIVTEAVSVWPDESVTVSWNA
jgi:hypothetical protein